MFNPRFPMNLIENKHPVKEPSDPSEDLFSLLGLGLGLGQGRKHPGDLYEHARLWPETWLDRSQIG